MYSKKDILGLQAQGVVNEYERHVREGHLVLAAKIRQANPDLLAQFVAINKAIREERETQP